MTDYTPTTEEVRNEYANCGDVERFDRWLADYTKEVLERAKSVVRALMQDPAVKGNKARTDVLLQVIADLNEAFRGDAHYETTYTNVIGETYAVCAKCRHLWPCVAAVRGDGHERTETGTDVTCDGCVVVCEPCGGDGEQA